MAGADKLERRHPVIRDLRKLAPARLRAMLSDGKERELSWKPDVGNKWERLTKLLDSLEWDYIEALDAEGHILGRVERPTDEEEEEELETLGWSPTEQARVMLEVMRSTQRETRQMFDSQMRGVAELVTTMTEGMKMVVESFNTAMKIQSASTAASAMGDDNSEVKAMLGTALQMMLMSRSGATPTKEG